MKIVNLSVLVLLSCSVWSQQSPSEIELAKTKDGPARVKLLLKVAEENENNTPVRSAEYARQAIALSENLHDSISLYKANLILAQTYYIRGYFDSSMQVLLSLLPMVKDWKDSTYKAMVNMNIGIAYREMGDFEKALSYCLEARHAIESSADELLKAKMDDALQVVYNYRSEYDKAIMYGERVISVARKTGDNDIRPRAYINLAINYIGKKNYEKGEQLLNEALPLAVQKGDKRIESVILFNLADLALRSRDKVKLKRYCRESLRLSKEIGSKDNEALGLRATAISFLMEKNIDSAEAYAKEAYHLDTLYKFRNEELPALMLLSNIAFSRGDVIKGLDLTDTLNARIEKIIAQIVSDHSADLEKKYETARKDQQILLQQSKIKQQAMWNYVLTGSAVSILLLSFLGYRNYRHRQRLQQQRIMELETEKQLAATEAVLKGEEQERTRLAKDLHDGLGGMLSGIKYTLNTMKGNLVMTPENAMAFERSLDMLDSSIREMRRVAHNMMPEALVKFGLDTALKDLCNDVNQSGALQVTYQSLGLEGKIIDQTKSITIYRIVQELLNNILKHAGASHALVQVSSNENQLTVTVEDDGRGFDSGILNQSRGIGWLNIQHRVDFLKGRWDVDSSPGKGTSVQIEIAS